MDRKFVFGVARLASLWVLLGVLCPGSARAADLAYRPPSGGLQISLTTNANKFEVDPRYPLPIPTTKERRLAALKPSVLVASVMLANRGVDGVLFTFADAATEARKFRFKVFAANGTQLWESDSDAGAEEVGVEALLEKRVPWRRTVQVPLTFESGWLASGRYTLEASLDAEGGPGATAIFEVVNLGGGSVEVPPNTGIGGRVVEGWWLSTFETASSPDFIAARPVSGAHVTVREILPANAQTIRAPFAWSGYTDADGSFRAPTLAGRFRVTASRTTISGMEYRPAPTAARLVKQGSGELTLAGSLQSSGGVVAVWPGPISHSTSKEIEVPLGEFVSTTLELNPQVMPISTVHSVEQVSVLHIPTLVAPPILRITAQGTVNSGGWSNARLVRRNKFIIDAPSLTDAFTVPIYHPDVVEFDLVATPPNGPATTVMSPVAASIDIPNPNSIREVRVYSQTNSQTAKVQ